MTDFRSEREARELAATIGKERQRQDEIAEAAARDGGYYDPILKRWVEVLKDATP